MGQGILGKPGAEIPYDTERTEQQWQDHGPAPASGHDNPADRIGDGGNQDRRDDISLDHHCYHIGYDDDR